MISIYDENFRAFAFINEELQVLQCWKNEIPLQGVRKVIYQKQI